MTCESDELPCPECMRGNVLVLGLTCPHPKDARAAMIRESTGEWPQRCLGGLTGDARQAWCPTPEKCSPRDCRRRLRIVPGGRDG